MIDETEIWDWIDNRIGSPFDFSGWAFSFLDTPSDNYFSPFFKENILQMLEEYKKVASDYAYKQTVLDPLNRRLRHIEEEKGSVKLFNCKDLGCIVTQAAGKEVTLYELMAMPA